MVFRSRVCFRGPALCLGAPVLPGSGGSHAGRQSKSPGDSEPAPRTSLASVCLPGLSKYRLSHNPSSSRVRSELGLHAQKTGALSRRATVPGFSCQDPGNTNRRTCSLGRVGKEESPHSSGLFAVHALACPQGSSGFPLHPESNPRLSPWRTRSCQHPAFSPLTLSSPVGFQDIPTGCLAQDPNTSCLPFSVTPLPSLGSGVQRQLLAGAVLEPSHVLSSPAFPQLTTLTTLRTAGIQALKGCARQHSCLCTSSCSSNTARSRYLTIA